MRTILVLAVLAAAGCGGGAGTPVASPKPGPAKHEHGKGPNGGVVFDLGKYHAEFTVDHDKKQCTILMLGDDEQTVTPVVAKELKVTTKPTKTKEGKEVPALTITLKPTDEKDGKAAKFTGDDPGLGNVAEFAGTVAGVIDGKPASESFQE